MSIFYICGKPGGGKTYLGVQQIIHELSDPQSDRFICTNIELKLPEIAEYLHTAVNHEVNLSERIRILNDSEAGEFWLFEPGRSFEKRRDIVLKRRTMSVPDFEDRAERGCLYVIDEVHQYFGAREWQHTGTDATFFLSQHRKLRCDVVFITQHVEQTDKALRRLAQEYMTVRNLGREPVLGFNLGSWFGSFRFVRSLNSPQSPNPAVFETGFVDLKPDIIGKFYDTMAGVGIAGRVTPKVEKRGRSLFWLLVPIAIFVVGLVLVFSNIKKINSFLASGMKKAFFGGTDEIATNKPVGSPSVFGIQIAGTSSGPLDRVLPVSVLPVSDNSKNVFSNGVFCCGYVLLGQPVVYMSDGSVVGEDEGLEYILKRSVIINHKKFPLRYNIKPLSESQINEKNNIIKPNIPSPVGQSLKSSIVSVGAFSSPVYEH